MQQIEPVTEKQKEYYSELPLPEPPSAPSPIGPNNPPWSSPIALGIWILSVLLIFFVPLLLLFPYVFSVTSGNLDQDAVSRIATSDPIGILIQVLAILPVHLLTLAAAWFVVTNQRSFAFTEMLGWESGGMRWWHYLLILFGFLAVMIIVGNLVPEQENDVLRIIRSSRWALYTVAFFATFTAPLVEELVYRGLLYSAIQRSIGTYGAVALVTFLFALVHVPQYYPSYSTIFLLTLLSLILTSVRVFTGNLLPCIILHTIFNGFQSAILLAQPQAQTPAPSVEHIAALIRF